MKNNHELMKGVNRIFLLLLLSAVCCYTSFAQPPCDTPFYIDGNPTEWDDPEVTGLPFFSYVLDPYGQGVVDNAFTQGTKDFLIASKKIWEIGQTKPKNDLCNGAAVVRVDCNGDYLLHFAGDRSKIQGDAMIGFWLLLNGTGPVIGTAPNGQPLYNFAPEHAYGDLLILSNFQNGGRLATVLIYMWVGPGNGNYGNNNSLILTSFTGTAAQNNDAMYDIPMGWSYPGAQYPLNAFYEGVINLNEIYEQGPAGALPDLCKATWLLEARSSTELTAALDDFIGGPFGIEPLPPSASLSECYPGYYCLEVTPSEPGVIRWYPTEADALAGTNMIQEGVSYCTNFTQTTTLYITLTNVVECTSAPGMAVMTITGGPEVTDSHTNVLCYGGSDGTVTLTFSGGASPYMVNFNGGGFVAKTSPAVYSNLAAGTYSWVVKDANNCTADGSEVVTQPTQVTATDNHTNVLCYGGNDGSVTITFSGGTPPYMVNFNGGGFVAKTSPAVYSNLTAGTYSWVVKDANNCTADGSEVVGQPPLLEVSLIPLDAQCALDVQVYIPVTITGGTAPYQVKLDDGDWEAIVGNETLLATYPGSHTVYVKDANNCTAQDDLTIDVDEIFCETEKLLDANCEGSGGSAIVYGYGGVEPYEFLWDNGETTQTAVNLSPGVHLVTIWDARLCETQCEVTIGQLPCEELCTYTQGKYGNQGNSSICDGEMSYPTAEFVEMLLGEGELALGWGANLLIFQSGDAGLIDAILPSQGSNELITGTCYVNTPCISSYLTRQGRLKSGLIGQTLTLGLNLRINDGLSTFELQSEGLLTTQEVEECGTGIPVEMVCEPIYDDLGMIIGYDMVVNPYWYDQVNPGLLCYMAENGYDLTVGGLYLLANHALGGFATFPASVTCGDITYEITLTTIKDAVDMINNIFDECRIFVGYLDEMILCPPVFYSAPAVNETAQPVSSNVEVSVMPNPFSVSTEITVTTPIDTRADVEVYDMTGRRITSLFSGNLLAGSINTFRFTTDSRGAQQSFMLVVRSQQGVVVKRIIDMK